MYKKIINKIVELGDSLPRMSGNVADIGENQRWLTEIEIEIEIKLAEIIGTFPGKHSIYGED